VSFLKKVTESVERQPHADAEVIAADLLGTIDPAEWLDMLVTVVRHRQRTIQQRLEYERLAPLRHAAMDAMVDIVQGDGTAEDRAALVASWQHEPVVAASLQRAHDANLRREERALLADREFLASTFRLKGRDVTWRDATVAQHDMKSRDLRLHALGTIRSAENHEAVAAMLRRVGADSMAELLVDAAI
jgi:hypothetical protein